MFTKSVTNLGAIRWSGFARFGTKKDNVIIFMYRVDVPYRSKTLSEQFNSNLKVNALENDRSVDTLSLILTKFYPSFFVVENMNIFHPGTRHFCPKYLTVVFYHQHVKKIPNTILI